MGTTADSPSSQSSTRQKKDKWKRTRYKYRRETTMTR
jgi:hypothetical protein